MSDAAISPLDKDARIAKLEAALVVRDTLIETLRLQLSQLRRMTFGQSSEKLALQIAQLELALEELEGEAEVADARKPDRDRSERAAPVRALPAGLPRDERRIEPDAGNCTCPDCGGALRSLAEDSDEMLDVAPVQWRVIRTVRPKYSCRSCEKIVQAPAPVTMTQTLPRQRSLAPIIAAGLFWSAGASAQTPSVAEPDAPTDIIVTATKRAESVQTVPISITAITSELLARQGVNGLAGLDLLVPGFKFGQSGNDARPAIRGTRTQQVIGNADPLVAFYSDGIYRSRPGQGMSPIFDVERVEVARGPQGTLFGRNSFGGAINVITRAPRFDETSAGVGLEYGSLNTSRVEGFANVGGANVALRLSGYVSNSDGWVKNTGRPGNDLHDDVNQVIRGALKFQFGSFTNTTRLEHWHGGGAGPGDFGYFTPGVPINPVTRQTNGVTGVIDPVIAVVPGRGGGYGGLPAGTRGDSDYRSIARGYAFVREVNQTTLANESNLDLGFADARLILSYTNYSEFRQGDPDYSTFKQDAAFNRVTAKTYSQEFQLASKGGKPFSWVVGAFLLQDTPADLYTFGTDNSQGPFFAGISLREADNTPFNLYVQGPFTSKTNSVAFYGDGTFAITPSIRLIGGLRWTQDKRTATIDNTPWAGSPLAYGSTVNRTDGPLRKTFEKLTYRVGAQFDIGPRSMLYGTYSTGFLAGGYSGAPSFSLTTSSLTTFDPQTATAFEIGSKNTFMGGKLRANISAYRNVYNNLVTQVLTAVGNAISTRTANAGKIKSWGIEGEFDYYPSRAAYLGLRVAYTNARFGVYGAGNNFSEGPGGFALQGLQVPLNPDFTATVIGSYEFDAGGAGTFTPSATVFTTSSYRTTDQPYFFSNQGAYTTIDASLRWKPSVDGKLAVSVFGKNLTDQKILLRSTPNAGSVIYQDFANPRQYGVRLAFNY